MPTYKRNRACPFLRSLKKLLATSVRAIGTPGVVVLAIALHGPIVQPEVEPAAAVHGSKAGAVLPSQTA